MESPRFFDLVRWGIAEPTLNTFFATEKLRHSFLANAHFTHGRDEYFPIPQEQIVFTNDYIHKTRDIDSGLVGYITNPKGFEISSI
jgi:hypothetical protein